jgi:regulation of enolase protein 1 (concanavalin A-like superfamily)
MRDRVMGLSALVCMLAVAVSCATPLKDEFNRPDGGVGHGWTTQTDGTITAQIVNNEVLIAGTQGTDWVRCGISRPVSNETKISFDFKADNAFNVHVRVDSAGNGAYFEVYTWPGGTLGYATSTDGSWPGWVTIAGANTVAGAYNTVMLELAGKVFTVTLNGKAVGTVTNSSFNTIESVLISSDAAAGTTGSLHVDNVLIGTISPGLASDPNPAEDSTDVPRDVVLGWMPGIHANTHDVYLGTTFDDVNSASLASPASLLISRAQTASTCAVTSPLNFGQTYYWRVDETNAPPDRSVYKGFVWSFTAEPYSYPVRPAKATASGSLNSTMGPEKTIDGSGLNSLDQHGTTTSDMWLSKKNQSPIWIQYEFDQVYKLDKMWVWNANTEVEPISGFGALDVTVETSTDGATWTALADVPGFSDGTGEPNYVYNTVVDFGGVSARYVKLTINMNWAFGTKQAGLSEVRFFCVPVKAFRPAPAAGATEVALDGRLNWRPGRLAASHQVYLGTDPKALSLIQATASHSLDLGPLGLQYGKTYTWRVDEVNDAALWQGDVWSFTTPAYAVVDDFEGYDDLCKRVFFSWQDGFGYSASAECGVAGSQGNGSGSTVGNINPPFAEQTITHSGAKSMPMWYDNTKAPFYSETQREWPTGQNWTIGGVNSLTLWVQGDATSFMETSPGTVVMNGTGTDIWDASDQFRFVYKALKGNGSIVARVEGVGKTNDWAKAGVMIRESMAAGSTHAFVAVTPTASHGISYQRRVATNVASNLATDVVNTPMPQWVKLTRTGNTFAAQYSGNGTTWTDIAVAPAVSIPMATDVFVGLAVTSHAAGLVCGAKFSNVSTTGGASGAWQVAEVGTSQVSGNAPETSYVAVADSAGKMATVNNLDKTVIATGNWEQWIVPLSQFRSAGVNLGSVKKMVIGVGDRGAPKPGSSGKLYIDDIRLQP